MLKQCGGGWMGGRLLSAYSPWVLAIVLGAIAGASAGAGAGTLAALAGPVSPAVLAVAVELRQRNIARMKKRQEVLRRFAPPEPTDEEEGEP
jgi:hypothetical protein